MANLYMQLLSLLFILGFAIRVRCVCVCVVGGGGCW